MDVSDDHLGPDNNPDERKLEFYGEISSATFHKQKRKRNSTALQLLGKNTDVATEIDVPLSKEQNVAQQMNSKLKPSPIGCTENIETKQNEELKSP